LCINIPRYGSHDIFISLAHLLALPVTVQFKEAINRCFELYREISINDALYILLYCAIAGKQAMVVIDTWVPLILERTPQLFSLSYHFFSRDSRAFFSLWHTIKNKYTLHFWPSFWADQIWRAITYSVCMIQGNEEEARKCGQRLPFIFTKKLWKKESTETLCKLHHSLVNLDRAFKLGESEYLLDIFYFQFFYYKI
jgi:hypothetical protein